MSEPLDEKIMVRAFLLFLGVSLIMMGFFAIALSQATQTSEGGGSFVVIVGPFIFAMGKDVPSHVTVFLVVLSLALILLLAYLVRKFVGGGLWE